MNLSRRFGSRVGSTLAELVAALVVLGIVAALASPRAYRRTAPPGVDRAVAVIAADLQHVAQLAAGQRRTLTVALEGVGTYAVRDSAPSPADTVRLRRDFTQADGASVESLGFSPIAVQVRADGSVSTPLHILVSSGGRTRSVTLATDGRVTID